MIAEQTAATAIPTRSNVSVLLPRARSEIAATTPTTAAPPSIAATAIAPAGGALAPAAAKRIATARPAPLETPITYGPAIGFWKYA